MEDAKTTAERSPHQTLGEIGAQLRASGSYVNYAKSRAQNFAKWASRFWSTSSSVQSELPPCESGEIEARTTMLHRRIEEMAENLQDSNVVIDESWLLEFTETHQQYMESCSCQGVDFNVMGSTEDFLQFVLLHPKVQAVLKKLGGHEEVAVGSSVGGHRTDTSRSSSLTFSPNPRGKHDDSADKTAGESVLPDVPAAERLEPERLEDESLAKAEVDQLVEEKVAAEEVIRIAGEKEQERLATEAANAEAEVVAKAESDRMAAEIAAKEECDRLAAEKEQERLAAEAAQVEAIRLASELAAKEDEAERLKQERLDAEALEKAEAEKLAAEIAAKDEADRLAAEADAREEAHGREQERPVVPEAEHVAKDEVERLAMEALVVEAETEKPETNLVMEDLSKGKEVEAVQSILGNDMETCKSDDDQLGAGNRFGVQLRRNQSPVSEQTEGDRELLAKLEARRQQMASGGALSPRSQRVAAASDADELDVAGMTMQQKMAARRRLMEEVE